MYFDNNTLYYFGFIIVAILFYLAIKKDRGREIISRLSNHSGPTPFLNLYTTNFTELAQIGKIDPVIGREDEVRKVSQILSRRGKNNVILVGDPGVGKTAIVEGLAQRIVQKEVPENLLNKRLLSLDVATLLSGTKYRGEFEQRAKKIVQEITASNRTIILFIDEIHSVIQSHGTEGAVNFSDILKPALARGDLQMIGATTIQEYEKYIKSDASLERRFQPVEVTAPNAEETLQILQGVKNKYRDYHKVEFTDAALKSAIQLTEELIHDRQLPDKAIDAVDEAAAMVKVSHVNTAIPKLLYQAAVTKYPEVKEIWDKIQSIDSKIITSPSEEFTKTRELLEDQLAQKGLLTVDSDDIEKVIKEWKTNLKSSPS